MFYRRKRADKPSVVTHEQTVTEAEERLTALIAETKQMLSKVEAARRDLDRAIDQARAEQRKLRR